MNSFLDPLRRLKQRSLCVYRKHIGKMIHLQRLRRIDNESPFRSLPIFIINLERDKVKRNFLKRQLLALGITNCHFFPAIDAKAESFTKIKEDVKYNAEITHKYEGRTLSNAIIALSASHLAVYREIINRNLEFTIVLEDDAIFVQKYVKSFCIKSLPANWDVCLLEGWLRRKPPDGQITPGFFDLTSYRGGTAGYIISNTAAKKLLSASNPLIHPPDGNLTWYNIHTLAGDFGRNTVSHPLLKVYLAYPFPLLNGSLAGYWKSSCDSHWVDY